uniref:Uncharacterized protein n=1 Tax=Arundo donax TaxID=35708 RepID=A0A0A9GKU6_ARUDO
MGREDAALEVGFSSLAGVPANGAVVRGEEAWLGQRERGKVTKFWERT